MTDQPALTGTVSIDSLELLHLRIQQVDSMLQSLANARKDLQHLASRPVRETWSTLPSLVLFAASYINAASTTVAIIDQAELKVSGMVTALRTFVTDFQHQDQAALDALAALERKADAALAPAPARNTSHDTRADIDPRLHQRAV